MTCVLRASIDMFDVQRAADMILPAECSRHSHSTVDNVAAPFPFAIQHLLGIDSANHHHHHHHRHNISPVTQQQEQQQQLPTSSALTTATIDDVTYSSWVTCLPNARHVTQSSYCRLADTMMLDDVIGSVDARRQSSSYRLVSAASLACLPSPTGILPALTDNASGKLHSQKVHRFKSVAALPPKISEFRNATL